MSSPAMRPAGAEPRTVPVGRCPLCRAAGAIMLFRIPDRLLGVTGSFTYHRCTSCETVYQDPRVMPEDLWLCYPPDYYTHLPPESPDPARHLAALRDALGRAVVAAIRGERASGWVGRAGRVLAWSRRLRWLALRYRLLDELNRPRSGPERVLDVGCGAGMAMAALARAGWNVCGVEWDPRAAEVAQQATGRPVWVGDFRTLDLPRGAFDIVLLEHVLEHLEDTGAALERIAELLAPGGAAILVWPHMGALGVRLFGERWLGWDPPRHLVLPTARAVIEAARRFGLIAERVRRDTRHGSASYAVSRAFGQHRSPKGARPGWADHGFAWLARALEGLGFAVGEEIVLVLRKPNDGTGRRT